MKRWHIAGLDSLFFREAKPFNSGEGGFLDSRFPPTAQTVAGVIRSAIAEAKGVEWSQLHQGGQPEIAALIGGSADDPGRLRFAGPYLMKGGKRLYPVPLHLLYSSTEKRWSRLAPSSTPLQTDMGKRRLPEAVQPLAAAKPVERGWLDAASMAKVLRGQPPDRHYREEELFVTEPRTGIRRDNRARTAVEGMLYFTRHIRLQEGVTFAMDVAGADDVTGERILRLGGEGRMAHVRITEAESPTLAKPAGGARSALLVLLTHGDFDGKPEPELDGIEIVSACTGKAVREGGWDYRKHRPKPLKSLVPAGSAFFVKGDIASLHQQIGYRTAFGYGEIAVGTWEDTI